MNEDETPIAIFNGKRIRRKLIDDKWFFSVVDIVGVLTDSEDPRKYWNKLSQRLREEGSEVVTKCHRLKLMAGDGLENAEEKLALTSSRDRPIALLNKMEILPCLKAGKISAGVNNET